MDLRFIDIPKIENDALLEDLAKALFKENDLYENVNINGRPGQKQDGVDVFARRKDNLKWVGIQCKVRSTNKSFTKADLILEIDQAKKFNPQLSEYYLYTTLSRDNITQQNVREIADELTQNNEFLFDIKFWEDIEGILKQKEYETVYFQFYHKFFVDNLNLGHSIGKLLNLHLGFDNELDSQYDLMIGKIPKFNGEESRADYYRGTYYVVNLNEYKVEFFHKEYNSNKAKCFPSDIEIAFPNKIDCYRISKWINSFMNFDDFIYNDKHHYKFYITNEEREDYFKDYDE